MPIGPSHGSRGGGSSFGGGSRSGGGSRRSSSSSGGGNLLGSIIGGVIGGMLTAGARRRYRNSYNGDGGYENEPATPSRRRPTVFLVLAIITLLITGFTGMIRNGFIHTADKHNDTIAIMTADYEEYKDLFEKAEEQEVLSDSNPNKTHFITKGKFNRFKYSSYSANPSTPAAYEDCMLNGIQYYFIVYEYKDVNNVIHKGTTYSQFSGNQVDGFVNGAYGEIEIAYTIVDGQYVSMNTSYKMETCAEYKYTLAMAESNKILASKVIWVIVGEVAIMALFVVLYVLKLKKYRKLVQEDEALYQQKQQAETQEAQARAEEAQRIARSKGRVCKYCGVDVPDDANACPGCGSRDFE